MTTLMTLMTIYINGHEEDQARMHAAALVPFAESLLINYNQLRNSCLYLISTVISFVLSDLRTRGTAIEAGAEDRGQRRPRPRTFSPVDKLNFMHAKLAESQVGRMAKKSSFSMMII